VERAHGVDELPAFRGVGGRRGCDVDEREVGAGERAEQLAGLALLGLAVLLGFGKLT
jgi:hypothetical protein